MRAKDGGYRLRDNTQFHLYVSTSPCGDARLNSPYEITTDRKSRRCYLSPRPTLSLVGAHTPRVCGGLARAGHRGVCRSA